MSNDKPVYPEPEFDDGDGSPFNEISPEELNSDPTAKPIDPTVAPF